MDDGTLRKVQLVMLDIAKEIKRICEENQIQYFIDCGSLLGAVRHQGFIPWDDDMDIGMLRPEYEKFISIAREQLRPEYFLQTWDSDEGYPYAFAKVRRIGTVYDEARSTGTAQKHREIWVDVLPYDVYPDGLKERQEQYRHIMLYRLSLWMKCGVTPWSSHEKTVEKGLVFCKYIPFRIYAGLHSRDEIKERFEEEMRLYDGRKPVRNYFIEGGGAPYGKWILPARCVSSFIKLKFEDDYFDAPAGYDEYLTHGYGDYMKLPPMDKRGNQHHIVEVKV